MSLYDIYISAIHFLSGHAEAVIAVCALAFTVYQAFLSRRHNRLSVTPHLAIFPNTHSAVSQGVVSVELLNNGLGPAIIKNYQVYFDNRLIADCDHKKLTGFFENLDLIKGQKNVDHHLTTLGQNYAMAAGDKKQIVAIKFPKATKEDIEKYETLLDRFDLVVKYKSMYGKKFTLSTVEEKKKILSK